MDTQITLRDYLRVAWSGRWLILVTTLVALLIGALLAFTRGPEYTATSRVYLGQATTVSGIPVGTPYTNPSTAPLALTSDQLTDEVARRTGLNRGRVRDAVELSTPRISGANVPTILTVTATDRGRTAAVEIANAYGEAVLDAAAGAYGDTRAVYEANAARAERERADLLRQIRALRSQLANSDPADFSVVQAALNSALAQLDSARRDASEQAILLVKAEQIEAPQLLTRAEEGASAYPRNRRLMTIVLAGLVGFAVGLIATFVWRGSPATRGPNAGT